MSEIIPVSQYIYSDEYFSYNQAQELLNIVRKNFRFVYKYNIKYFNVPCSFDIETTSFIDGSNKAACMYCWSFCLYGVSIFGRTWEEFLYLLTDLQRILDLHEKKRLVIYVQNLDFEFQFFRKLIAWEKVFAIGSRRPIQAISVMGFEFRCSYVLSGYKLETIAKNLNNYSFKKLVGNLDYSKKRHTKTPINNEEIQYSLVDTKIVVAYIAEKLENGETIANIPLTKTGYVRKYIRNNCFYENGKRTKKSSKRFNYLQFIHALRIQDLEEYNLCRRAFCGGFAHGNAFYTNKKMENAAGLDLTSSYPTTLIGFMYPMSTGRRIQIKSVKEMKEMFKYYCCIFDITFYNIRPKVLFENYISYSKCYNTINVCINNGRVVSADRISVSITEIDFELIDLYYEWDSIDIGQFMIYEKAYLPKDIIISILNMYQKKTQLKGVAGKEIEYLNNKEMINSAYGMIACHADIIEENYNYNIDTDEWTPPSCDDYMKSIEKYNKSSTRFTFYPWALYCTAYARRNLMYAIYECGNDYIYSDTDSVKTLHYENHKKYFDNYNLWITERLEKCLDFYGIDKSLLRPKTIENKEKPLGIWDYEDSYKYFKCLGAKRYMYENVQGKQVITISGVKKDKGLEYLQELSVEKNIDIFDLFTNNLQFPPDKTGKMTHTYIDNEIKGKIVDYTGAENDYYEQSAIHLENAGYNLSIAQTYVDYFTGIQEE